MRKACRCRPFQAPGVGLEPTTYRLTADRSAIELPRNGRLPAADGLACRNSSAGVRNRLAPAQQPEAPVLRLAAAGKRLEPHGRRDMCRTVLSKPAPGLSP